MSDSPHIILETNRLLLRRLEKSDLDALFALYSDEETRQYFPEKTLNVEETSQELEWFLSGHPQHPELGLWATTLKETEQFIGRCGLLPWSINGQSEIEIAFLLDKTFWGQGFATEAARGIVNYGFEHLGLSRLICLIDPQNTASIRVAERIGMTLEQTLDGIDGDGIPTLMYALRKFDS